MLGKTIENGASLEASVFRGKFFQAEDRMVSNSKQI